MLLKVKFWCTVRPMPIIFFIFHIQLIITTSLSSAFCLSTPTVYIRLCDAACLQIHLASIYMPKQECCMHSKKKKTRMLHAFHNMNFQLFLQAYIQESKSCKTHKHRSPLSIRNMAKKDTGVLVLKSNTKIAFHVLN